MFFQQDSERELIDLLGRALDSPDLVGAFLPERWTPTKGTFVTVQSDGTPVTSRSWTRETLRVTVHGAVKSQVSKVMRAIDAFILSPWQGHFLSVKPGVGILTMPDSRLGGHISSATYRVAQPRIKIGGKTNGS
ncbi:hypothetical protein [Corynebacterium cystitidis]|uniref:hypothetical protein n=1 Tax=Corynebacterium cystitidis TaxID=35757 RepID=UPI00211E94FF|nr:hypothetical protein [Corynebacterium cystitidis]